MEDYDDYDPLDAFESKSLNVRNLPQFLPPLPPPPPPPPLDGYMPPPPPTPLPPSTPAPPPPPPPSDEHSFPVTDSSCETAQSSVPDSTKAFHIYDPAEEIRKNRIEREEHAKRMESENKKRKLLANKTSSLGGFKLRKVTGLKAFDENNDDNDPLIEDVKVDIKVDKKSALVANTSIRTSNATTVKDQVDEISTELSVMITKTAVWMVDNPDKASLLLEKSRENKGMSFLFDRHSPGGMKYQEEYSRCKAEKEVRDVFHGSDTVAVMPTTNYTLSGSVGLQIAQAAQGAAINYQKQLEAQRLQQLHAHNDANSLRVRPPPPSCPPPPPPQLRIPDASLSSPSFPSSSSSSSASSISAETRPGHGEGATVAGPGAGEGGDGSSTSARKERRNRWGELPTGAVSTLPTGMPVSISAPLPGLSLGNIPVSLPALGMTLQSVQHQATPLGPPGVGSPQFHSQYQYQQQQQQQQVKLNEMTSTVLGAMSESALPASAIAAAKKNKAKTTAAAEAEAAAIAAETLAFSEDVPTGTMGLDAQRQWDAQVREQKEMQLLEEKIRQAARGRISMSAPQGGSGGFRPESAAAAVATSGVTQRGATEEGGLSNISEFVAMGSREEQLYQDRLREYEELAERYDENFRDTVEDAERNGGVIDGGTWEHRKRAKEMLETARTNLELTALAAGSHHIADFLPKQELDKFLKRADAIISGEKFVVESDFQEHKLDESNLGYQMLKKAGWTEGSGLGATTVGTESATGSSVSSGGPILEPINMTGMSSETTGLGVQATHEVSVGDDEFDQYRKRMMLAYRFRPNPLNNPRRNYY